MSNMVRSRVGCTVKVSSTQR